MTTISRLRSLWRNLVHRSRVEREIDDELRGAYELLTAEKMLEGMGTAEAHRAAAIELGGIESVKERVRAVRAGSFVAGFVQDARFTIRLFLRSPVFTVFALASLTLGIGAMGALFSLLDVIVLRKLPVPEPDQLVVASFGGPNGRFNYSMPYPHYEQIRSRNTTMSGWLAMYPFGRVTVEVGGQPEIAEGLYVSGDYYTTLRLQPAVGRLLAEPDDRPDGAVAVLNHAYWQRRFGGREDVLGSTVTLNKVPFTIVGVEPPGFAGAEVGRPYDISVPLRASELMSETKPPWNAAFATWIYMMGRLKPGVSLAAAEQELRAIFAQVSIDGARTPNQSRLAREHRLRLEPAATGSRSDLRTGYERWLELVMLLLGAVLLLATLNLATLLLSRSDARQREITTRLAIGASRWRIVRQFLTESLVLAAVAGALGSGIASWGSGALLRIATPSSDRPAVDLTLDSRLLMFTAAVAVASSLLFGLIPAIRATAPRSFLTTRQIGGGRRRRVLDRLLVASQVGLSLVLLVGAGLFLRTLDRIWALDTGYDRSNVLMFSVDAKLAGRRGPEIPATYQRLLEALRGVPGAKAVSLSAVRPVSDSYYFVDSFTQIGERKLADSQAVNIAFNRVAPGYFALLHIPLIAGRDFDERDSLTAPPVAIVSERMARHFEGNPIGQRLGGTHEVIGVVKDVRYARVKDRPREVVYFPIFQSDGRHMFYSPTFEIRYAGSVSPLLDSIRATVSRVEPGLAMFRVRTLEAQTRDTLSRERLLAVLASYFGGFAVLLACIGLYGLMSYGVAQRTAEMGLRIALGAQPARVRWLIVRDAAVTVLAGATAGIAGSFAAMRVVRSQLFGVEPHDPLVLTAATLLLLALAFVAAYVPARRASRIDPLTALRHE